jgi:hypothetical protein
LPRKLTNGTTYYYVVTSASSHGESKPSSRASAIPAVNPAPAAPAGVTAAAGDAHVNISWGAVPDATSYSIYWSTTTEVTAFTGTQIADATSPYVLTGLVNGTHYYFLVTSVNGNGESTPSLQVGATPSSGPYISALIYTLVGGGVPPWGWLENVRVCSDSTCTTPIDNATVTVNGRVLPWSTYDQRYLGTDSVRHCSGEQFHRGERLGDGGNRHQRNHSRIRWRINPQHCGGFRPVAGPFRAACAGDGSNAVNLGAATQPSCGHR